MDYDVIVAGGSVSGLLCAREIASHGQRNSPRRAQNLSRRGRSHQGYQIRSRRRPVLCRRELPRTSSRPAYPRSACMRSSHQR